MNAESVAVERPVISVSIPDILSVGEVAKEKGVTVSAVYQMIDRGRLRARKMGTTIYFLREEIYEYLNG